MEDKKGNNNLKIINFSFLVFFKSSILFSMITSFDPIQLEYSLNNKELGLIITFNYIFSLVGSLVWMTLITKYRESTVLTIGGIIWIIGIFIIVGNQVYYVIVIGISIVGFGGESLAIIAYDSYDNLVKYKNRGKSISLLYSLQGLGGLFGIFFTGIMEGTLNIEWRMLIGLLGIICILFLFYSIIILIKFQKNSSKIQRETIKNQKYHLILGFENIDQKIDKDLIRLTIKNRTNLLIFILILLYLPIYQFNNIWLQKYWIDIHGLSQTMASISIIFTSAGEFLGVLFSGIMVDNIRKKKEYNVPKIGIISGLIAIPLYIIGYLLVWSFDSSLTLDMNYIEICLFMFTNAFGDVNIFLSYTSLFMAFLFNQMIGVIFLALILDCNGESTRNLAINIQLAIINLGHLIAPILGGFIGDLLTLKYVLLMVPFACLIATIFFIGISKTAKMDLIKKIF